MNERAPRTSLHSGARIAGVVYLLYFVTAITGGFFTRGLVVSGNAVATANNILAHESLFRLGLGTGLVGTALYVVLTVLLYELFKPVSRKLSLIAAFSSLLGCSIQSFSTVFQFAPFVVLGGDSYLGGFSAGQLQTLALLFLKLNTQASDIYLVFFGLFDLLIGCLILSSIFLPRILGALLAIAGVAWLAFLSPPLAMHLSRYILPLGFVAELVLCVWLLVKGVNEEGWNEQVSAGGMQSMKAAVH